MHSNTHNKLDKAMTAEQFTQVVDAILSGKYSWACVLILRYAGYNPLHYIPYRTYNRLMKENNPACYKRREKDNNACNSQDRNSDQNSENKIADLAYLESVNKHHAQIRGGDRVIWLSETELRLSSNHFS